MVDKEALKKPEYKEMEFAKHIYENKWWDCASRIDGKTKEEVYSPMASLFFNSEGGTWNSFLQTTFFLYVTFVMFS